MMRTRFVPPVRGGLTVTQQYRGNTESNTNKYGPENLNKYGPGNLDTNVRGQSVHNVLREGMHKPTKRYL